MGDVNVRDMSVPAPDLVVDLLQGARRTKVMYAGVSLGIFDALDGQSSSSSALALLLECDGMALERLLNALVGLGLLSKCDDLFSNTPVAQVYLTTSSPRRMTGYLNYSNTVGWPLWGKLEDAVREGTSRWKQCFGWDEPIFSSFFKSAESANEFLMGMHGFGVISSPALVNAIDLTRFQHLVDLGGATGHLAIAACERYAQLRATVFDLPQAVPLAQFVTGQSPVANRVAVISGDFFTDPLPEADLYSLGRILHDWSLDKIQLLLAKIFASLPVGGGLLIAEKMLNADKSGPSWAQMQDLNMLICTEGKERTLAEYGELLLSAGFAEVTGYCTQTPIDGVLAIK
jgi:acetylserotonin N-methyltransferase